MKLWKVVLGLCLCLALFAAFVLPMEVEAAGTLTVYLDPAAGNDSADGLTEATAVKTYDTAYSKVKADGGTIVLLSNLEITTDMRLPKSPGTKMVTLTSKDGSQGISGTTDIRFNANTTLENLTVTLSKNSSSCTIYGEGKKLIIGENVNSVGYGDYYFSLSGGKRWASCSSTDLTVRSGTWRNIYVGTYGYKSGTAGVTGKAKLTMTGGELTGFICPSYSNSATVGSMEVYLSNMSANNMYCAAVSSGTVTSDVTVTLGEGAKLSGSLYSGSNASGSVTGQVNIILDGADISGYSKITGNGTSSFTGTLGGTTITLKSGVLGAYVTAFDHTDINIPEGKTLTVANRNHVVDTVQCAGTLNFAGLGSLEAKSVTGTVNCTIQDRMLYNHVYIVAPTGSGFVFDGYDLTENNGVWEYRDWEQFQGLILTAQSGVTVHLYTGFDMTSTDATKVEPYAVEGNTKYYPNVTGKYHYVASGTGYYTYQKNVYISPEEALTATRIDATPDKKTGTGWHTSKVYMHTDEVMANGYASSKTMWPDYAEVFTTPVFTEGRPKHQHTTQSELENFIQDLDDLDDDMYVYSIGKSTQYNYNIPLALFTTTDLSGAATLEEAAQLVKANGKPTIHYRAQIHGDEHAACEGALAVIKLLDGAYGQQVLDKVNVYVIPRLNPDGARNNLRDFENDLDGNRDVLRMEGSEMVQHHKVFCLFEPEVMLDGHEAYLRQENESIACYGALISAGFVAESNPDFRSMNIEMASAIFDKMKTQGLDGIYYDSELNGLNPNMTRPYIGSQGTLSFLIETRGIRGGTVAYERRVIGQVLSVTAVIDYVAKDPEAVQKVVDDERNRIITDGMTYDPEKVVRLETGSTLRDDLTVECINANTATGEITVKTYTPKEYNKILRARPAPTAYVIPAGESFTEAVLDLMDKQQISYKKIPEGSTVLLQQYTGTTTKAELTEETEVTFENGAYVFTMNQIRGAVLSVLMEPDVTDASSNKGTLAQQGILTATDGVFPIYRYIHDLNSNGFIDLVSDSLRGDMNGDESVSDADAMYLLRYTLFGEGRYPLTQSGDVNGDGTVSDADAMYLLRYTLFGESRYPLH